MTSKKTLGEDRIFRFLLKSYLNKVSINSLLKKIKKAFKIFGSLFFLIFIIDDSEFKKYIDNQNI